MESGFYLQMSTDALSLTTLIVVCLIGGLASTTVGTSGGFTFVVMATVFPVTAVVPIHASVEAISSLIRGFFLYTHINWYFLLSFFIGSAVGLSVAIPFLGTLPELGLQLILGLFIVTTTWIPIRKMLPPSSKYALFGGGLTSFLTIFVGATGPLVAVLISKRFDAHPVVIATHAACMTGQHISKVVIFAFAGWAISSFTIEIGLMIIATTIGTWAGRHIILTGSQDIIKLIFKVAVTLLGMKLVISAINQWLI